MVLMVKKTKIKRVDARRSSPSDETDGAYFFKLVLYFILGTLWIKFKTPLSIGPLELFGLPLGLVVGLLIARHDTFQIDRKIEYAVLILVTMLSFVVPYLGIFL